MKRWLKAFAENCCIAIAAMAVVDILFTIGLEAREHPFPNLLGAAVVIIALLATLEVRSR